MQYGSYILSIKDMEVILDALSYAHWNDRSLSESDRNYISDLYESLDNSGVDSTKVS